MTLNEFMNALQKGDIEKLDKVSSEEVNQHALTLSPSFLLGLDYNNGPTAGEYNGYTLLFWLTKKMTEHTLFSLCPNILTLPALNFNAGPATGPDANTNVYWWLVVTESGLNFLLANKQLLLDKNAKLNSHPLEGPDAATDVLFWLSLSHRGREFILSNFGTLVANGHSFLNGPLQSDDAYSSTILILDLYNDKMSKYSKDRSAFELSFLHYICQLETLPSFEKLGGKTIDRLAQSLADINLRSTIMNRPFFEKLLREMARREKLIPYNFFSTALKKFDGSFFLSLPYKSLTQPHFLTVLPEVGFDRGKEALLLLPVTPRDKSLAEKQKNMWKIIFRAYRAIYGYRPPAQYSIPNLNVLPNELKERIFHLTVYLQLTDLSFGDGMLKAKLLISTAEQMTLCYLTAQLAKKISARPTWRDSRFSEEEALLELFNTTENEVYTTSQKSLIGWIMEEPLLRKRIILALGSVKKTAKKTYNVILSDELKKIFKNFVSDKSDLLNRPNTVTMKAENTPSCLPSSSPLIQLLTHSPLSHTDEKPFDPCADMSRPFVTPAIPQSTQTERAQPVRLAPPQ